VKIQEAPGVARINVEQKALTDPRFRIVGNRLDPLHKGTQADIEQAFGMFLAIRVWEYAQERGTDKIPGTFVEAIYVGLTEAMIEAELLEPIDDRTVRVRGWDDSDGGWLERQRRTSRAGGVARSLDAKRGQNGTFLPASSSHGPAGLVAAGPGVSSALTLTPALTPALKKKASRAPRAACSSAFEAFWQTYPTRNGAKRGKTRAWAEWRKAGLEESGQSVMPALLAQIEHRKACDAAGVFCAEFQDAERWIRNRRWLDETGAVKAPGIRDGAYMEQPGDRPVRTEADDTYTARYREARRQGKSVDDAAKIAKSAMGA